MYFCFYSEVSGSRSVRARIQNRAQLLCQPLRELGDTIGGANPVGRHGLVSLRENLILGKHIDASAIDVCTYLASLDAYGAYDVVWVTDAS